MEKNTTEMMENDYSLKPVPTVEPFPLAARASAGVLLDIEGADDSSLRLASDGHVSVLYRGSQF